MINPAIDLTDDDEAFSEGDETVNWDRVVELEAMLPAPEESAIPFYDGLAGHG